MRVMVIVKASAASEAGEMPSRQLLTDMGDYNEELAKAGILLAGEGLHPTSKAVRVHFSGKNRIVTSGPFAETPELIGAMCPSCTQEGFLTALNLAPSLYLLPA
jgi:hypothetical protein